MRSCNDFRNPEGPDLDKRIVVIGAGAIGGYAGGHMTRAGHDVTLVDAWPEHVEYMRRTAFSFPV